MEVITKDLEGLFKTEEERRGVLETLDEYVSYVNANSMIQMPKKYFIMTWFLLLGGYIMLRAWVAWIYFLDSYPVTHTYESWNIEVLRIRHRYNLELMES